jgi:hypothetical protein
MPTPAALGEIHEVVIKMRQESQQVLNVLFFRCDSAVDDMELRLLTALLTCLAGQLRPVAASTWQIVGAQGKRVYPDLGPVYEVGPPDPLAVQGESEGDALPSFCSIVVNIHSTRGGRSGRGRMFIPGIPEGASQGSSIPTTNPYWAAILAYLACVAAAFVRTGSELGTNRIALGVLSRKLGGVDAQGKLRKPPYDAAQWARATRLVPNNLIKTTNSRKIGHGN